MSNWSIRLPCFCFTCVHFGIILQCFFQFFATKDFRYHTENLKGCTVVFSIFDPSLDSFTNPDTIAQNFGANGQNNPTFLLIPDEIHPSTTSSASGPIYGPNGHLTTTLIHDEHEPHAPISDSIATRQNDIISHHARAPSGTTFVIGPHNSTPSITPLSHDIAPDQKS